MLSDLFQNYGPGLALTRGAPASCRNKRTAQALCPPNKWVGAVVWPRGNATTRNILFSLRLGMKTSGTDGPSSSQAVKDDALDFALVKHPSDPGDPAGKFVLGVRSASRGSRRRKPKQAADATPSRVQDSRRGSSTPSPVIGELVAGVFPGGAHQHREESEVRAFVPRPFRPPVCVPARVAKCFCTVDILDE